MADGLNYYASLERLSTVRALTFRDEQFYVQDDGSYVEEELEMSFDEFENKVNESVGIKLLISVQFGVDKMEGLDTKAIAKFDREYIFTPLYVRTQTDTDYEGDTFEWTPLPEPDANQATSLGMIAHDHYFETCEELGEDPDSDNMIDFMVLVDRNEYEANMGSGALANAEGCNAVMTCGYGGYQPTGAGKAVGYEVAGLVTRINPDSIRLHIDLM